MHTNGKEAHTSGDSESDMKMKKTAVHETKREKAMSCKERGAQSWFSSLWVKACPARSRMLKCERK